MAEDTNIQDHSEVSYKVLQTVEEFVEEIGDRGCTSHFEAVLNDGKLFKGNKLEQKPEAFTERYLIFKLLHRLDHPIRTRPVQYAPKWKHGRGIPDFCLTTVPVDTAKQKDLRLFGESKTPNKIEYARTQVKEYLEKDLDFHAVTVLSDGFEWELWVRPLGESPKLAYYTDLQPVFREVKSLNLENESYSPHKVRGMIHEDVFKQFTAAAVLDTVRTEFGIQV